VSSVEQVGSGEETTTLRLERSYEAPAEEVFDAWTNPEVLRRWWFVERSQRTPVADVDLRVGGGYRLTMEDEESGARHTVVGEYHEIRRPELLVYSWRWELDGGGTGHESTVTVRFIRDGERTTVVLIHSGLEDEGSRDRHGAGWTACLGHLQGCVLEADSQAG
jgi:uncharacterized protein YndB with AHSA1/START domain